MKAPIKLMLSYNTRVLSQIFAVQYAFCSCDDLDLISFYFLVNSPNYQKMYTLKKICPPSQ